MRCISAKFGTHKIFQHTTNYTKISHCIGFFSFIEHPSINSELLDEVSSPVTGGPDNIMCEANGIPTPTVRWTKKGNDVAEYSNIPGVYQIVADAASILYIENATSSDDGTYTCTATNHVGRDNEVKTDTKETRLRGQ